MPDILLEVRIAATPEKVYRAITQQQGLSKWWTPDVVAQPEPGSVAEFRFPNGYAVNMEVAALEEGRTVCWNVQRGAPEWTGTRVTWDLTQVDNGTSVRFAHRDYPSTEGSFASAGFNWAFYLASLKDYLEIGIGRPGQLQEGGRPRA